MRRSYICIDPDCPPAERFMVRLKDGGSSITFEAAAIATAEAKADRFEADAAKRAARRGPARKPRAASTAPAPAAAPEEDSRDDNP
ncbi:hypothetical protein [Methylobacterium aquaticum]|uniref:Uncharacterized protein n=1 Tax=Methylobacterium aquaticum TaxID=270351 RepID=A0A0C6FBZ2_9HYPH|nr:hypothetical protein [Methylobacterium aquaticum]BAQ44352.1 hypothetical protein Maq22A_c04710 [Methylobacterium aquaticum]